MPALMRRHPVRQSRDPNEVTLKIAQRDPSTVTRDDRILQIAERMPGSPRLNIFAPAEVIPT